MRLDDHASSLSPLKRVSLGFRRLRVAAVVPIVIAGCQSVSTGATDASRRDVAISRGSLAVVDAVNRQAGLASLLSSARRSSTTDRAREQQVTYDDWKTRHKALSAIEAFRYSQTVNHEDGAHDPEAIDLVTAVYTDTTPSTSRGSESNFWPRYRRRHADVSSTDVAQYAAPPSARYARSRIAERAVRQCS